MASRRASRKAKRRTPRRLIVVTSSPFPRLEAFVLGEDGNISVGPIGPIACAAVASDEHRMYVASQRRRGETLMQLLARLEISLGPALDDQCHGVAKQDPCRAHFLDEARTSRRAGSTCAGGWLRHPRPSAKKVCFLARAARAVGRWSLRSTSSRHPQRR